EAVVWPNGWQAQVDVTAPLTFAGYGVTAPELGHDDYAGLDVKGRIVVLLNDAPASFPSEPRAHYASTEQKIATAARHGAIGVIGALSEADEARYPWERVVAGAAKPSLVWAKPDGTPGTGEPRVAARALVP